MLRNLGIRWQILSALALPVLVLGLISSQVTYQALVDMREASQSREYAEAAGSYEDVVAALQSERALSVDVVLKRAGVQKLLTVARTTVDSRLADLRAQVAGDSTSDQVKQLFDSSARAHNQLTALRADLDGGRMEQSGVVSRYTEVIDADVDMPTDLAVATRSQATAVNLQHYGQLARATEALAREQLAGTAAILSGRTVLDDRLELGTQVAASTQALATFRRTAPADQQAALKKALVAPAARSSALVSARASFQAANSVSYLSIADWSAITGGQLTAMRNVLAEVKQDGVRFAESDYSSARSKLQLTLAAALGITLLTLLLALGLSRRISAPLRRLTLAATQIRDELPKIVESVQEDEDFELHLPVVQTLGSNEVSLLAAAFVDVNAVTVEIAREQARLRAAVADMFVNVARRNQVLLSRQLSLIDQLERNEVNPDALEELFRLDHLATRMRRNAESLLVLAGIESGRRLREPMPLSDVVRTATSEIEHYSRVTLSLAADPPVFAHLALPIAHMLAEVLENATNFSDPGSTVVVMSSATNQGIRMTVADDGLGMSAPELLEINARIEEPPTAEALSSQRLGLFVVGRLARRLDAKVTLTSGRARGTAVLIDLPASLFMPGTVEGGSNVPEQPALAQHSAAAVPSDRVEEGLAARTPEPVGATAEPFVAAFPGAPALPAQFDAAAFDAVNALEPVWTPQPDDLPIGEEDARIAEQIALPSLPVRRGSAAVNEPSAPQPFAVPAAEVPVAAVHEVPAQSSPEWATSDWVSEPSGTSDAPSTGDGDAVGASLFSGFKSRQAEDASEPAGTSAATDQPEPSPSADTAPVQARAPRSELPEPVLDPTSVTFLDSAESVDGWYDPTAATSDSTDPEQVFAESQSDRVEAWDAGTDPYPTEPESGLDEPAAVSAIANDLSPDEYLSDPPAYAEPIPMAAGTAADPAAVEWAAQPSTEAAVSTAETAQASAAPEATEVSETTEASGTTQPTGWTEPAEATPTAATESTQWAGQSAIPAFEPEPWSTTDVVAGEPEPQVWTPQASDLDPAVDLPSIPEPWSPTPSEYDQVSESWTAEPGTSEPMAWSPEPESFEPEPFEPAPSEPAAWSLEPATPASESALPEPWTPEPEPVSSEAESWSPAAAAWAPEPVLPELESWSPEPADAEPAQLTSEPEVESWSAEPWAPEPEPVSSEAESWSPAAASWAPEPVVAEPWDPEPVSSAAEPWNAEPVGSAAEPEIASWSVEPVESEPESWSSQASTSEAESWSTSEPASSETEIASWSVEPVTAEAESASPEPATTQLQSWSPEPETTEAAPWSPEPAAAQTESWSPEPAQPWSPEPAATQTQSWSPEPEHQPEPAHQSESEHESEHEPATAQAESWSPEPERWTPEAEPAARPAAPAEMRSELSQTLTASIDILPARTTFRAALSRGRRKNDATGTVATPFNGGFDPIAPAREFALREGFGSSPEPDQEPTSGGLPAELTKIPVSPISRVPEPSQPRDAAGLPIERRQHPRPNDGPRQGGRSALASEALTELSRLSSYSPTSMPSSGRVGLQRRTPGEVPVEEQQQPVDSGGRARTAASVRSMLAGFKAGVERGRTSPSANRPATDREPPQPPQPREPQ
jgi:signal transduction histidine kinase